MQTLTLLDFLLAPIYIIVIYVFARRFRDRHYPPGHPWRAYFMNGLFLKVGGATFIVFLYAFYYGAGDTIGFYHNILIKNSVLFESPWKWINIILEIPTTYDAQYIEYISQLSTYHYGGNAVIVSFGAVVALFAFNSFLVTSILFAVISFTGMWALFRIFAVQYPRISRHIAFAALYFPSVFVWGSGIFKDTLCMFGLGWLTYFTFQLLIQRKFRLSYMVSLILCALLIAFSKIYILAAIMPGLLFWVLNTYATKIRSSLGRFLLTSAVPVVALGLSIGLGVYFSDYLGQYAIENVAKTSEQLRSDLLEDSKSTDGSGYDLGEIGSSPVGMVLAFPKAVNVTLFRPYLWESRKVVILFSALESTALFVLFLYIIFKVGPVQVVRVIRANPNIQFCLIFTLIFAFAVGISTFNFGTLSRYKIPCLPFFGIALALIYDLGTGKSAIEPTSAQLI